MSDDPRSYSLDEARALIPGVRAVLLQLAVERRRHAAMASSGAEGRAAAAVREGISGLLAHLEELGVVLRDVDQGLIDIPTQKDGNAAWFCWQLADPELAYWHTTREGFATRKPL